MALSDDLQWRGLIKDTTFEDISWLDEPKTFYFGVDANSSDSLTIGNLAGLLVARRLLRAGWKTVLLVGGATSLIGDPGGKDEERDLVSRETVEANKQAIQAQVAQVFAGQDFIPVDNYDWFKDVGYLEFLRDVGKHFSMTELMQRDYIAERIGEGKAGISYAEFSYSLIQGYDFWQLFKDYGVVMQIGGSDQWGNMLSGVPLIRKKENAEAHALSYPLVVDKTTGKKFGKSEDGAIWLDVNKTSVYTFYQFWLNCGDLDVEDYLKVFTLLDRSEIEAVMQDHQSNESARVAQRRLAYEVTKIVHGQERADSVVRVSDTLFGARSYSELEPGDFEVLAAELPTIQANAGETTLIDLLVDGQLASSRTEARRFLEDGAVYVNGEQLSIESNTLSNTDSLHGFAVLRRGKNMSVLVRLG